MCARPAASEMHTLGVRPTAHAYLYELCLVVFFRYADSMETDKTTPTLFAEADTLRLLSSLVSWEEDTGRSMRVKVCAHCIEPATHH